jgi:glycosyltransferase involved in cell wall biosynthesis
MKFDTLYQTIASVLNQDYNNIELFVSDDGSPSFPYQEVVDFIENNKGSNISSYYVLNNKQNVGTVRHINNILKQASGDLLIPLAGDDIFYDNSVLSKIVEKYNSTHFKVLSTSRALYISDNSFVELMPHYKSRNRIAKLMATAEQQHRCYTECKDMEFASGSAMAYEADFLREMNYFDERYFLWEDGPFINKMTSQGYPITTAYDIISIQYKGGGVSSSGNPMMYKDMQLFNSTDRRVNDNYYGWYHKRILRYTELKYRKTSFLKRIFYKVLYIDIVIDQIIYQCREKLSRISDKKYMK